MFSTYTLTNTNDIAGPFEAPFITAVNITTTMPLDFQRSLDGSTWVTIETVNSGSKNVIGPGRYRLRATAGGTATVQVLK